MPTNYTIIDDTIHIELDEDFVKVVEEKNEQIDSKIIEKVIEEVLPKIPIPVSERGTDGKDGKTPTKTEIKNIIKPYIPKEKDIIEKVVKKIPKPKDGKDGEKGEQGEKMKFSDLTPYEKQVLTGPPGNAGEGVARGGTTGQKLVKKSNKNFDTEWQTDTPSASAFTDLTDTFSDYTGLAGKGLRVNATANGIDTYTPTDTDEKVKYDVSDTTAGYIADKVIAGTGISVAEGTGANENKLVVNSTITQATRDSLGLDTDDTVTFANLSGTNTGDQALPTRDSLGLDTDDTVTFANLSGTNTGDQDLSGKENSLGNPSVDDYVLSSKADGTRSWIAAGGGGGTPGGDSGDIQYNNAGSFGGFGKYDATNKRLGVNQETPLGTGHFGADTYTVGDASALVVDTYTALTTGGVPFGAAQTYRVYGKRTEKTVDFFSVNPASVVTTAYSVAPVGAASLAAGSGYQGDGTGYNFTVYPLYETDTILGHGYSYSISDSSGYPYGIDHTITPPNWGTPSGYIIVKDDDNTYTLSATSSVYDDNNIWNADAATQLATYTQYTGLQIDLSWGAATNASDYRVHNVTQNKWTDKGDADEEISDTNAWTSGTPTLIPTYFTDTALISDGQAILKEELAHQGTKAGFYNTTPIYKPTGDVATALDALGLVGTPTYGLSGFGGTAYRIPFFDASGVGTTDGDVIFRNNSFGFGFEKTSTTESGIYADTFDIASQFNVRMRTINTTSGARNNVSVANYSHVYNNASGVATFSGFSGGYDGKILFVTNGPSGTIEFIQNSTLSSVGNRIQLGAGGGTFTMTGYGPRTYMFIYDSVNTVWKLIGGDREIVLSSTNVWLSTNSFSGYLLFNKGHGSQINTKTSAYTTTIDDYMIDVSSGTFAITLMASNASQIYVIKNNGTGTVTLNTTSSQTIDGQASGTITLAKYDCIWLKSKGTNQGWAILNLYRTEF